jgi:hypothetical protein
MYLLMFHIKQINKVHCFANTFFYFAFTMDDYETQTDVKATYFLFHATYLLLCQIGNFQLL